MEKEYTGDVMLNNNLTFPRSVVASGGSLSRQHHTLLGGVSVFMNAQIKPCTAVGNAFMVVRVAKFGRVTKLAIGLTKFEAQSAVVRLRAQGKRGNHISL